MGAGPDNHAHLPLLSNEAVAMKMYLNKTYSSLQLDSMEVWMQVRLRMGNGKRIGMAFKDIVRKFQSCNCYGKGI